MRDGKTYDEEAFARMLEGAQAPRDLDDTRMRALVSALERARPKTAPKLNPEFSATLRAKLVAESMVIEEASRAAHIPLLDRFTIRLRARNNSMRRSFRVVTAAGVAAVLLIGSGAVLASARNAIPGQWNYSIKRAEEGARLMVTNSPLARGYLDLDLARERLKELKALSDNRESNQKLYNDTFSDMDASTVQGSELLINASRAGAGKDPLTRLANFAAAQRVRLAPLMSTIPLGVTSAGRASLALLDRLIDRVGSVIAGCPCPANPLEIPTAVQAGQPNPAAPKCSCNVNTTPADSNPQSQPSTGETNRGNPNGPHHESPSPTPSPSQSGLLPSVNPTNPTQSIDGVLNKLGISIPPTPLPLPTPTISL